MFNVNVENISVRWNEVRVVLAAADTIAFVSSDLDVALIAPGGTPGVSDKPVVFASFSAVSNHCNGVINLSWAWRGVENTTSVHLEIRVTGTECNWKNTFVKSSFVLGNRASLDRLPRYNMHLALAEILASTIATWVRICWCCHLWVLLEILPSCGMESTIASMATCNTINKLLFWESQKVSSSSPVSVLDSCCGAESPARTALALVFNRIYTSSGNPVDTIII